MSLSSDLISEFAKVTNDDKQTTEDSTRRGTIVMYDGSPYVQLDGSDLLTPITTTTDVVENERVIVEINNHTATVIGNISSPAARTDAVQTLDGKVDDVVNQISEFEIVIADKVDTKDLVAASARIDELHSDNVTIKKTLTAYEADITALKAEDVKITGKLEASEGLIEDLEATKLDAEIADITYATIKNLEATNVDVHNLSSTYAEFASTTTDKLTAIDADIKDLDTKKLSAEEADVKYANIDFSNIGKAAFEYFYAESGLIDNVVVGDGTITGNLVGVTIKGDLIEGNTIVADKLVILGDDGLYYKLNTNGVTTETEQTDYNSINGSIITANSITATKINVDDLVAFDATIGGFKITDDAIYSGVKETVDNTTRGIYMDNEGQIAFGDSNDYIKYYRDSDDTYKLAICAQEITLSSSGKTMNDVISDTSDAQSKAEGNSDRLTDAESTIKQLVDSISMIVTDENGTSLFEQTSDGWSFSLSDVSNNLSEAQTALGNLTDSLGNTDEAVDALQKAVSDLGDKTAYINIGTDVNNNPCLELGKVDNNFKVRITNTAVDFLEGSSRIAYINNQTLYITTAIIEDDLNIRNKKEDGTITTFTWGYRGNGNFGLQYKGGAE